VTPLEDLSLHEGNEGMSDREEAMVVCDQYQGPEWQDYYDEHFAPQGGKVTRPGRWASNTRLGRSGARYPGRPDEQLKPSRLPFRVRRHRKATVDEGSVLGSPSGAEVARRDSSDTHENRVLVVAVLWVRFDGDALDRTGPDPTHPS